MQNFLRRKVTGPGKATITDPFPEPHQRARGADTDLAPAGLARCPAGHPDAPPPQDARREPGEVWREAEEFIRLHHSEEPRASQASCASCAAGGAEPARRLAQVREEIEETGTYRHTPEELAFGARVAWRNSNRCIGRLYWRSLQVRDRRHVADAAGIVRESAEHLRLAGNTGRIRPLITVFAPDEPARSGPRIWNEQLIRYAGYPGAAGAGPGSGGTAEAEADAGAGAGSGSAEAAAEDRPVHGDPRNAGLTALALRLGWPGGPGSPFDVLPLLVEGRDEPLDWFELPPDAVLEVELEHPEADGWAEFGLRWHAVPAIANMCLEVGGVCYPAAPFNGWYMGTEIGARDLADTDRYDLLPRIADRLGLDTTSARSLWKDRALVELNRAVLHSFDRDGVTMADHHTESLRFLSHLERERSRGRKAGADWSWIVPPMSGAATPVFHRSYDPTERRPAYVHHPEARARSRGEELV
ncbi:nitric oxide synthase oxygenase [Streptomyces sp. H27-D2]|uniref:nitric oxide synthase oxygenase n=1 Tax=Streptomyces sp. H27-D2 TaxID=3046304 RepID=UPI002DBDCD1B|nr:nitric oxide synthase oxygenase [Streptomyces sp. H27-D2]MEC4020227.1 nitric oxide synthase oxygenase [Streptomyces sp. H27-D2]